MAAHKKQFEKILAKQSFDQLERFKKVESWSCMNWEERELLAKLFLMQGEIFLREGDSRGLESFELATRVAPKNPAILYRQALAYSNLDHMPGCLEMGCEALRHLIELEPNSSQGWELWARLLLAQARLHRQPEYLEEAGKCLQRCLESLEQEEPETLGRLLWLKGQSALIQGRLSGEAVDFNEAIKLFELAKAQGLEESRFLKDFAEALFSFGGLVAREDLVRDGIALYDQLLKDQPAWYEVWLHRGQAFHGLWHAGAREEVFKEAVISFENASKIRDGDSTLWKMWGELLQEAGSLLGSSQLLQLAADKLAKAHACDPKSPDIYTAWALALMHLGAMTEQLPLLRQAEEKALKAVQLDAGEADHWLTYALCLAQLGLYFADDEYLCRALEKYEYAATLNSTNARLAHGMAKAYLAAGELRGDLFMMERSLELFGEAVDLDQGRRAFLWSDWGIALMKIGELSHDRSLIEAAVERFEQAIHLQHQAGRSELECLYHYGCALDYMGDFHEDPSYYERAVQVLAQVVSLDPNYVLARYNLGLALSHLGEISGEMEYFHRATEQFHRVVEVDEEDEIAWNDWGLTLLSLAQLMDDPTHPPVSQHLKEEAEVKLLRAVALGSLQAFYNLACLYSLLGLHDEAIHYLERAELNGVLPPIEELLQDDWLEGVRQHPDFQNFISHLMKGEMPY